MDHQELLNVYLLGLPRIEWQGQAIKIQRRTVRGLFYRLATDLQPISRDQLCLLLWADISETTARRNLTHALTHLRMALPTGDILHTTEEAVNLEGEAVWCDVTAFRGTFQTSPRDASILDLAIALYRGPFLTGFALPACAEFELWATQERSALERLFLEALETRLTRKTTEQDYGAAIHDALLYLQTDDLAEPIHRKLIALYAAAGDRNAALRQYEQCITVLERELGINPLPETRDLYRSVLAGVEPLTAAQKKASPPNPQKLPGIELPLFGRERDWRHLQSAYKQVQTGGVRVVLISGENGVGKSHLMHTFARHCWAQDCVLSGAAYPGGQILPYQSVVEAIRKTWGEALPVTHLPPVWLAEVSRLFPELRSQQPDLPAPLPAEPEEARLRLFDALSRFILCLTQEGQAIVLCLDDLQWADSTTLDWLVHFARQADSQAQRLLILGCYRSEGAENLAGLHQGLERMGILSTLKLEGLGETAMRQMLRHWQGPKPKELSIPQLYKATGGNPFFLLELLRTLAEADFPSYWNGETDLPLPRGIQAAVQERLGQLDARTRQVLEVSALLEAGFSFDWIQQTAGRDEVETMDSLDTLTARHWLIERDGRYQFAHDLARQAVAAALSPARRQLLHRRAAWALETLQSRAAGAPGITAISNTASMLAHHFDSGGESHKALDYHTQAARQAEALFAWQEAEQHHTRSLALLQQIDPGCTNAEYLAQRGQILTSRAHLHFLQSRLPERDADLKQLAELAERSGNIPLRLLVLNQQIRYHNLDGQYRAALRLAEQGIVLAESDLHQRCHFLAQIGFAHYFLGEPDQALSALEAALAEINSPAFPTDVAMQGRIAHILGYVYFHLGNYAQSLLYQQEALRYHQQVRDNNRVAWDTIDIGSCYLKMGHFPEAELFLQAGLALAQRIGSRPAEAYGLNYSGYRALYQGDYPSALTFFQQALSIQHGLTTQHVAVLIEIGLGLTHLRLGDQEAAQSWLRRAATQARALDHRRLLSDALSGLGLVHIAARRLASVGTLLSEAIEPARASRYCEGLAQALALQARLARLSGDAAGAIEHAREAAQIGKAMGSITCEMWGEMEAGLACLDLEQIRSAAMHLRRAAALQPPAFGGWITSEEVQSALAQV